MAKYLIDDVPILLKSEGLHTIPEVLNIIFNSLPANAGDFIKWVAEVRRLEEDGPRLSMEEKERLAVKVFLLFPGFTFILSLYFSFEASYIGLPNFRKRYCNKFMRLNYLNLSLTSCFLQDHVMQICCLLAIKNC